MESRFLSSAHSLIMFYMCTRFRENTLKGFRIVERTRFFTLKITKVHNFINNVVEVMVFVFSTLSDPGKYLYQVS